jgi:hypothetical protein
MKQNELFAGFSLFDGFRKRKPRARFGKRRRCKENEEEGKCLHTDDYLKNGSLAISRWFNTMP